MISIFKNNDYDIPDEYYIFNLELFENISSIETDVAEIKFKNQQPISGFIRFEIHQFLSELQNEKTDTIFLQFYSEEKYWELFGDEE